MLYGCVGCYSVGNTCRVSTFTNYVSVVIQLSTRVVCQHPLTNDFLQCEEALPCPSFGSYFIEVLMLQFVTIFGMVFIWNHFLIRENRLKKNETVYSS